MRSPSKSAVRYGPRRPLVIAVTGVYMRPPHGELARIVGCDHFLTKPFDTNQLEPHRACSLTRSRIRATIRITAAPR